MRNEAESCECMTVWEALGGEENEIPWDYLPELDNEEN